MGDGGVLRRGGYGVLGDDEREEDDIRFDVFKRGKDGFVAGRKQSGWVESTVLGRSFRLAHEDDDLGKPVYTLEVR